MPDTAPLAPGDPASLGDYALVGRLGEGGQGVVFLGSSPDGERVAVKFLHGRFSTDPSARARMAREVAAARQVAPFCTARVLDYDIDADQPYIVSEYIDGPSLHDVVAGEGPRTGPALDRLAIGTATALSAIHQHGIVHRDFKPANVLIGPDGPRVVDFGIARASDVGLESLTATGAVVGTPGFLAPEQFTDAPLGPAVDVFAWGATMVFAASARLPFEGDTLPAIINRVLHHEPDLGNLTGSLRDVVSRCLAKDPASRPDAREALLDLLGHAGSSSSAHQDILTRGTRFATRVAAPDVGPPPAPVRPATRPAAPSPPPYTPPSYTPPPPPPQAPPRPGPVARAYPPPVRRRRSRVGRNLAIGCVLLLLLFSGGCLALLAYVGSREQQAASSTPSPPPSPSPSGKIPQGFGGTWTGTVNKDGDDRWFVAITLLPRLGTGAIGYQKVGKIGRSTTCSGRLVLVRGGTRDIRFSEDITAGSCVDAGQVTLTRSGDEKLRFKYRADAGKKVSISGTLAKRK